MGGWSATATADDEEAHFANAGGTGGGTVSGSVAEQESMLSHPHTSSSSSGHRRVWLRAAESLLKGGARWDPSYRSPHGQTQLYLFLSAYPPARDDNEVYHYLLRSALAQGLSPLVEDTRGRNALFVLCEQLAGLPAAQVASSD